jgi:hypothetical protein
MMRYLGILATWVLVIFLAPVDPVFGEREGQITVTPVAPGSAFVFSPQADVAAQFKVANPGANPLSATLAVTTFAGGGIAGPFAAKIEAKGETGLEFKVGKLAAGFYRMDLAVSRGKSTVHNASFPLAILEREERPYKAPLLPIGVYVNGAKHLLGQGAVVINTYTHAMARDIAANHFNTVVVGEAFGPDQIAIFGRHGLAVVVQSPSEELLGLEPVIGGILGEDPPADGVTPLMEKHKALSAKTEKPLLICVRGDLASTKDPNCPLRTWGKIWEALKQQAASVEEMMPHVRRYWHYYPIEYGPAYPILQSYVYRGCLSFMDSLQLATSGLRDLPSLKREIEVEVEEQVDAEEGKQAEKKEEKKEDKKEEKKEDERKEKKKEKKEIYEFFGWIPVWVRLQAFGTTRAQSVYKVPTPAQLQTMMHLSLAFGAKGVFLTCYQTDEPGHSGMVDPVSLVPVDGRLAAAGKVAEFVTTHAEIFAKSYFGGGAVQYTNPFIAPVPIATGSKEKDTLVTYLYVVNLNERAPASCWLYDLPRSLRDIATGEELKTEMYETRDSSWWGIFMTLEPGQARLLEKIDMLPTVHE